MSILEEVKNMKKQGLSETEIISYLQNKGVSYRELSDALAQSKIKSAIEEPIENEMTAPYPSNEQLTGALPSEDPYPASQMEALPGMQQSIMQTGSQQSQEEYIPTPQTDN